VLSSSVCHHESISGNSKSVCLNPGLLSYKAENCHWCSLLCCQRHSRRHHVARCADIVHPLLTFSGQYDSNNEMLPYFSALNYSITPSAVTSTNCVSAATIRQTCSSVPVTTQTLLLIANVTQ
jgi:hypothetical protein